MHEFAKSLEEVHEKSFSRISYSFSFEIGAYHKFTLANVAYANNVKIDFPWNFLAEVYKSLLDLLHNIKKFECFRREPNTLSKSENILEIWNVVNAATKVLTKYCWEEEVFIIKNK